MRKLSALLLILMFVFVGAAMAQQDNTDPILDLVGSGGYSAYSIPAYTGSPLATAITALPSVIALPMQSPTYYQNETGAAITALMVITTPGPTNILESGYNCGNASDPFFSNCSLALVPPGPASAIPTEAIWQFSGGSIPVGAVFAVAAGDYTGNGYFSSAEIATPEPASLLLFGSGLLSLGGLLRRKFRK